MRGYMPTAKAACTTSSCPAERFMKPRGPTSDLNTTLAERSSCNTWCRMPSTIISAGKERKFARQYPCAALIPPRRLAAA